MALLQPLLSIIYNGQEKCNECKHITKNIRGFFNTNNSDLNLEICLRMNSMVQVIFGFFYHFGNTTHPVQLIISPGLSKFELLSLPTVQLLCNLCTDVRILYVSQKKPAVINVKNPSEESMVSFIKLKENHKINPSVDIILRHNNTPFKTEQKYPRYFDLINCNIPYELDILKLALNNFLINFLLNESIKNDGVYGFPLLGWKKHEIEENIQFDYLCAAFEKVQFAGYGDGDWISTHLIVANPRNLIFDTLDQIIKY